MADTFNRRGMLTRGAAFGVGLALPPFLGFPHFAQAQQGGTPPPLPAPDTTGTLPATTIQALYSIAMYPAKKWSVTGYSAFDLNEFTGFANLKTQKKPAYYTAYNETFALYTLLVQKLGSPDAAMDFLYTPKPATPPPNWEAVRFWAIQEYLILFITSGNFRSYGWVNYPGWMGGPYNDPSHLPYRGI